MRGGLLGAGHDAFQFECAVDQFVAQALVILLTVVMLGVLRNRPAEMTFAERDHSAETLFFDRAHEALRVGIRIRRLKWRLHYANPDLAQPFAQRCSPLHVPVTDLHAAFRRRPSRGTLRDISIGLRAGTFLFRFDKLGNMN